MYRREDGMTEFSEGLLGLLFLWLFVWALNDLSGRVTAGMSDRERRAFEEELRDGHYW